MENEVHVSYQRDYISSRFSSHSKSSLNIQFQINKLWRIGNDWLQIYSCLSLQYLLSSWNFCSPKLYLLFKDSYIDNLPLGMVFHLDFPYCKCFLNSLSMVQLPECEDEDSLHEVLMLKWTGGIHFLRGQDRQYEPIDLICSWSWLDAWIPNVSHLKNKIGFHDL